MGSTAKILFGSFLAICIVGMFLLFSMQKSAQLSLDMDAMQRIAKEKDNKITAIKDALHATKEKVEQLEAENALIPELQSSLNTTEKEKLVYVQQLDDFQAELQNQVDLASQRANEITTLQAQQNSDEQLLTSLKAQNEELTATLEVAHNDLEERTKKVEEFADTLVQKDRVIQIYKEKLDSAAENIQLLQTGDTNEQLNLVLILDELAKQTALAKELGSKLALAEDKAIAEGGEGSPEAATSSKDKALIDELSLKNDYLETGLKELSDVIKDLQTKQDASNELLSSYTAEIEQLQFLVTEKDKELSALQLQAEDSKQQINLLTDTISKRD
ncbi:MAG: hypothetical protein DSY80_04515, partial [Desulfocapsa sp.]